MEYHQLGHAELDSSSAVADWNVGHSMNRRAPREENRQHLRYAAKPNLWALSSPRWNSSERREDGH